LGGFGFYDLGRDKSHYNITLMILIRKKVTSRNRTPHSFWQEQELSNNAEVKQTGSWTISRKNI
jgi:hypothetical protein